MKTFKILPLLIFVAMLSFSVRLFDVVTGVRNFSGSVQAATEEKVVADSDAPMLIQEEPSEDSLAEPEASSEEATDVDLPEWRDPVDDDPAYEAVKMEVFKDLAERRKNLNKKEREFTAREALLKAAEQELERKYQELNQLRSELESLLQQQSDEEKARIQSLVKIYEGMKPKDAARIFDTLDLDILTSVVSKMSERKLSPVLAAMNPERARTVTIMLAEQKKLPTLPQSN